MSIIRWDPIGDIARIRNEMDRMMSDLMGGVTGSGWLPAMDICDMDDAFIVKVDLPGISKENVEITTTENMIRIKGEARREEHTERRSCFRHERMAGSFERAVSLPAKIKPDETKASFKDGVLEIRLPKAEKTRREEHRVEVESQ